MINAKIYIQDEWINLDKKSDSICKWKDISVFMTQEAQQWVDGIKLHQQVVEVWHCGNHMHFLDNVVQIQLRLHEPGFRSKQIWVGMLAFYLTINLKVQ